MTMNSEEIVDKKHKKHIYFALDSDVLTNLADLVRGRKDYPNLNKSELREKLNLPKCEKLVSNFNFYNELLDLALNDEIRFLVTPTAYYESRQIPVCHEFIKQYCYLPNINVTNYKNFEYRVRQLAKAYCLPYERDEKRYPAPLSPKYNAEVGDVVPTNDAYIMAEASVCNANLITENIKHLILKSDKNEYYSQEEAVYNRRDWGIDDINIINGYCFEKTKLNGELKNFSPIPVSVESIGKSLKYFKDQGRIYPESLDRSFVRASTVSNKFRSM